MSKINRVNWTYVSRQGNSLVEIKHFLESGNLAIFCGKQIILTDFGVFGDAEYSFFIEEELCRIRIKKVDSGELSYKFDIVEDIDTPLNRFRKKRSRQYLFQSIFAILGIALLIIGLVVGGYTLNRYRLAKDLRENGIVKAIKVKVKSHVHEGRFYNAFYAFQYSNRNYVEHFKLPLFADTSLLTANGFPLENNDEFLVIFSSKNPKNSRIDFESPTERQIKLYKQRTIESMNVDSSSLQYYNCLLDAIYQLKNISGWANLYYKNISYKNNKTHNMDTYRDMMTLPSIQEKERVCKMQHVLPME